MKEFMQKAHKGATFIEYAMLAGLVAIVVAVAATFFGGQIKALFADTGAQAQKVDEGVKKAKISPDFSEVNGNSSSGGSGTNPSGGNTGS